MMLVETHYVPFYIWIYNTFWIEDSGKHFLFNHLQRFWKNLIFSNKNCNEKRGTNYLSNKIMKSQTN